MSLLALRVELPIHLRNFVAGKIKVGVAGWSYKDWEDIVYPASLKGCRVVCPSVAVF